MKKLLVFMILCIPLYAWGENAVFNPSFDMSPWDSGWTIETDTSSKYYSSAEAEVKPDSGKLLQKCCYLRTDCRINTPSPDGGYADANAVAMVTQNFDGLTDCMIKAYLKWDWHPWAKVGWADALMQACINNEWKLIWESPGTSTVETTWTEVCTTLVDDTLSGIRFCVGSRLYNGYYPPIGQRCHSYLWIDDIYVGEVGVEESEKFRVKSLELKAYPNPFVQFTEVRCQMPDVRIQVYDMMGRLVEKTESGVIGKDLRAGIYFVKIKGYNTVKIIKLMEVL